MAKNNKIIVILGPTSSGKSAVAIRLARKLALSKVERFNGAEIISADSRQIYRGLDVGTGKVTKAEQKIAKHHLLDIVSPRTIFSAAQFKKKADKIIEDILERGKVPIICGGTGFWIKAVVDNVSYPEVKPDRELRSELQKVSTEKLFKILQRLDPRRAMEIDRNNKVRLIRAIEIIKTLGSVPRYKIQDTRYKFLQIGIDITKEKLRQNIAKRLKKRWAAGMIKEVENLHKKNKLGWEKIQSFGLSYFWIPLFLQNKLSKDELFEKVFLAEKDYAKRQMTWFKKDPRIKWLKNYSAIEKETKTFLKNN